MNQTKGRPSEVGGTTGQLVSSQGVDVVVTLDIGFKALEIFKRYGIKVYRGEGKINDVIRQLETGRLSKIRKPT